MNKLDVKKITEYVQDNIAIFHTKRIQSLDSLALKKVLKRKNPYLFKAKYMATPEQIVKGLVDAHISSHEETIFGDWLEGLAIFINHEVFGGKKSTSPGIDLEFEKEGKRYIVAIKSGPNWGNSSQIKKMVQDFNSARKVLKTSGSTEHVEAVNGCCYGRDKNPIKIQNYTKLCGQRFWEFISGEKNLYLELIEPLGNKSKETNEEFIISYNKMITRFTRDFIHEFCLESGEINWPKLVQFNSQSHA